MTTAQDELRKLTTLDTPPDPDGGRGDAANGAIALIVIGFLVLLALVAGWPVAAAAIAGGLIGAALNDGRRA